MREVRLPWPARWFVKHSIKRRLVAAGIERPERKIIMEALQKFLTLDFAALKGWRTAIGIVTWLSDNLLDTGFCVTHPGLCAALKGLSGWFLAMGIRGK